MLNLEVGKFYRIELFQGRKYDAKAVAKTLHGDSCHSYLIMMPNRGSIHPYGTYVWDYGLANQNKWFCFTDAIHTCRELCESEAPNLFEWFRELKEKQKMWPKYGRNTVIT